MIRLTERLSRTDYRWAAALRLTLAFMAKTVAIGKRWTEVWSKRAMEKEIGIPRASIILALKELLRGRIIFQDDLGRWAVTPAAEAWVAWAAKGGGVSGLTGGVSGLTG